MVSEIVGVEAAVCTVCIGVFVDVEDCVVAVVNGINFVVALRITILGIEAICAVVNVVVVLAIAVFLEVVLVIVAVV